jgi:hypothetical protein
LGLLVLELMLLLVLLLLLLLQTSVQLGDDQCRHVFTPQAGNGYHFHQLCCVFPGAQRFRWRLCCAASTSAALVTALTSHCRLRIAAANVQMMQYTVS